MTHLYSTRRVFNSRCHLRTQRASTPLAAGGPHWGSLHRSPGPRSRPGSPETHPRSQQFGLPASALGAEATDGPQVTVEPGPLRALLRHWKLAQCWFPGLAIPNAKNKYIFQIKYREAILSNSTRKLLWFEITKMLIAVYKFIVVFIIIFSTLSLP